MHTTAGMFENDASLLRQHSHDAVHHRRPVSNETRCPTPLPVRPVAPRLRPSLRSSGRYRYCDKSVILWNKWRRRIKASDFIVILASGLILMLWGGYIALRVISAVSDIEIRVSWERKNVRSKTADIQDVMDKQDVNDMLSHPLKVKRRKKRKKKQEKRVEEQGDDEYTMPLNQQYSASTTHSKVGDRSDEYADLRQRIDAELPWDSSRSLRFVKSLFLVTSRRSRIQPMPMKVPDDSVVHHSDQVDEEGSADDAGKEVRFRQPAVVPYDIYHCPYDPPEGYPFAWNLLELLQHWPPDNITLPDDNRIYQGLCVFDYQADFEKALRYREAELPFVIYNDPQVAATVERWNTPGYMQELLGSTVHRTEFSKNNHFMFHKSKPRVLRHKIEAGIIPADYEEPTKMLQMTYDQWLHHANVTSPSKIDPDRPHWYFRLIGCGLPDNDGSCETKYDSSEWLFDELPFFQPLSHERTPDGSIDYERPNLYIGDETKQEGIHCRFGMSGVIAESHFDMQKNAITVLGGTRRYILSHPDQCGNLALYPRGHPSSRHSAVDWSQGKPDLESYPDFAFATGNEILLQAGQTLYLPSNWFHYIVSLELNMQCNTRSGVTHEYDSYLEECGFHIVG
jgi:Cupin-like domain